MVLFEALRIIRGCEESCIYIRLKRHDCTIYAAFDCKEYVVFTYDYRFTGQEYEVRLSIDEMLSSHWEFFAEDITFIDSEMLKRIMDSYDERAVESPFFDYPGKYIHVQENHGAFIAVENSDGNAWTEVFSSLVEAVKYLRHEPCVDAHGRELDDFNEDEED